MDAFGVLDEVLGDYENFVKGFLEINDDQIRSKVEKEIAGGLLWLKLGLALNPAFESDRTVSELVERHVLHPKRSACSAPLSNRIYTAVRSRSTATRPTPSKSPTVASPTC